MAVKKKAKTPPKHIEKLVEERVSGYVLLEADGHKLVLMRSNEETDSCAYITILNDTRGNETYINLDNPLNQIPDLIATLDDVFEHEEL